MSALNAIISVLAVAGMVAIAWGYRPSLRSRASATWYFTWGWLLLAISTGGRRLWWDVVWANSVQPDQLADPGGMIIINLVFNALVLVSVWFGLKARQLLLPHHEQAAWPWWKAWAHPSGIPVIRRFWT